MHIGVDARPLFCSLSGIGRYTLGLSKKLIHNPNAELFFSAPGAVANRFSQSLQPGIFRSDSKHNRLSKMTWSQSQLPLWAAREKIDLFWGAIHRLIGLVNLVIADSHRKASGIAEIFPQFAYKVRVVQFGSSVFPYPPEPGALSEFNIAKSYFLFVGTLDPRKNLDRLLKAFALIPESYRNQFSLEIVGGKGWGRINLQKLIHENQLGGSVKLLGNVADYDLSTLYTKARFLIMPSIYEVFGLPLLESRQYGASVCTSQSGAMAESCWRWRHAY
jgi:glycosyltransferase involved in cell wall biosynthesis